MSSMIVGASVAYAASPTPTSARDTNSSTIEPVWPARPEPTVARLHSATPNAMMYLRGTRSPSEPKNGATTK
jgi:hypothetical protein